MSYFGINPAQLGLLIPQDPVFGFLRTDLAIVFDLLEHVDYQSGGQTARHPIQSGREGPSDAILDEPERVTLSAMFVDKPLSTGLVPLPTPIAQPDRSLSQAEGLRNLRARRQLVTAILPGRILADRAITSLQVSPDPASASVTVSLSLDHVRVVSLTVVPAVADSDSKALGVQTTEQGM